MEVNPIAILRNLKKKMYTDMYSKLDSIELADDLNDNGLKGPMKHTRLLKYLSTAIALGSWGAAAYDMVSGKHHDALQAAKDCIFPAAASLFAYHFHSAEKVLSVMYRKMRGYEFSDEEKDSIRRVAKVGRSSHLLGAIGFFGGISLINPCYSLIAVPWLSYVGYASYGALYEALSDFTIGENRYDAGTGI